MANALPRKNISGVLRALGEFERGEGKGEGKGKGEGEGGASRRPWQLCVAGSLTAHPTEAAALRAEAEALGIGAQVEWKGELDAAALSELYRTADLFVLTSLYENFCMAAHEAIFFGVPVLAYDVGEIGAFGPHAGCTLLPVADQASFSTELSRLLRDPRRLLRMRKAAQDFRASLHERLKAQPSISAAVDDFEAHLQAAMRRRRAASATSAISPAPAATSATSAAPAASVTSAAPVVAASGARLAPRLALLFWLYALQGAAFGLVGGALPVLASGAPLTSLGLLSLSLLPFALKVALAPIIDVWWAPRLGRRRSWVVPCTALCGALFALLVPHIDAWAAGQRIDLLSVAFTPLVLLLSAQDVAVDAWALELLPTDRLSYAAACQTIGMSAGNVLGHPLLLAVRGSSSLSWFSVAMAAALAAAAAASLLVPEEAEAVGHGAARLTVRGQLSSLRVLLRSETTRALAVVCAWQRVGVVALDACAAVTYMRQPGAEQEHLAAFALAQAPIGVLASVLAARLLAHGDGAGQVMRRALLMLICSGIAAPLVLGSGRLHTPGGLACLLALCTLYAAGNKVWWTAQATAFNRVVACGGEEGEGSRALHLQLLNSLSNLGKLWPRPLAFVLCDAVGFGGCCAVLLALSAASWPSMRSALARSEGRGVGHDD